MNMKEIEAVVQCTLHVINLAKKAGKSKLSRNVKHNLIAIEVFKKCKKEKRMKLNKCKSYLIKNIK